MRVKDIINRVTLMYHDESYSRITQPQYLQLLDDAVQELITSRPDSHEKRVVMKLGAGARQQLPEETCVLIDVYANKTLISDGVYADGQPVFQVDRKNLDYFSNWYQDSETTTCIREFAYDVRSPHDFWVNPPVKDNSSVYVEIGYSYLAPQFYDMLSTKTFDEIMNESIPVSAMFRAALVQYMLYLLYSTDSTAASDREIAASYLKSFYQSLALEYQNETVTVPRIVQNTTQGIGVHPNVSTQ